MVDVLFELASSYCLLLCVMYVFVCVACVFVFVLCVQCVVVSRFSVRCVVWSCLLFVFVIVFVLVSLDVICVCLVLSVRFASVVSDCNVFCGCCDSFVCCFVLFVSIVRFRCLCWYVACFFGVCLCLA